MASLWRTLHLEFLVLGALFFLVSQIISAKRLDYFFVANGFHLDFKSNLRLYFLGMFYNFFIPGGIGGDAYKVYLLNKNFSWSAKKLTASLFVDRLSGLLAIGLIICILGFIALPDFKYYFIPIFILGLAVGYFLITKLVSGSKPLFWRTLALSVLVQLLQIVCFVFLLKSLSVEAGFYKYALLFLASSVLSLVSFAGIGIREMLFLQASKYFSFEPQFSVSASLLFTVITAFFSLIGLYFQLIKLNLKKNEFH